MLVNDPFFLSFSDEEEEDTKSEENACTWACVAVKAQKAGGLLTGGPNGCVWTNDVLPRLQCTCNQDHFVTQMGSAQAVYNRSQLSELVCALRDCNGDTPDAPVMPADDAAFVVDVDGGDLGPYAVLNAMARRLWKTPEAAAVIPCTLPPIAKRRRVA
jgi:hypothetical protein